MSYLIGFGDFAHGFDEVGGYEIGAAPKTGTRKLPKPPRTTAVEHHGKVLKAAHGVATKAAHTIGIAQHLLTRSAAVPKKPVHLGAAAAVISPKAKAAVDRHNAAVAKAAHAGKVLAQHAIKTKKSFETLTKHMAAQKKTAVKMRTPPSRRRVHVGHFIEHSIMGEVEEMLGEYYDAVGADPDPSKPGFLTDGSPDPAFQTPPAGAPAPAGTTSAPADPTLDLSLSDPTNDPTGQDSGTALPPPPPISQFIADGPGSGGIMYDGSKGTPDGYVLSHGLASRNTDVAAEYDSADIEGNAHFGYVWGRYDKKDPPNGGVGWGSNLKPGVWNHIHGRHWLGSSDWYSEVPASEAFNSYKKNVDLSLPGTHTSGYMTYGPNSQVYGPLIGNPIIKDFIGMRVDAQGNMFWLPQEAPDWLTFPLKQAAALTAQAAAKAEADAAKAQAAAAAKAQADAAAAQAAQDAANALAESQAASQAKQAASAATAEQATQAAQQAGVETQAQQALVQQSQADIAQQQMEAEQEKQAGALILQQAQAEQAYAAAHPEQYYAEVPPPDEGDGTGYPGDEGGGAEGQYDDGSLVPGADVMADQDGEGYSDEG